MVKIKKLREIGAKFRKSWNSSFNNSTDDVDDDYSHPDEEENFSAHPVRSALFVEICGNRFFLSRKIAAKRYCQLKNDELIVAKSQHALNSKSAVHWNVRKAAALDIYHGGNRNGVVKTKNRGKWPLSIEITDKSGRKIRLYFANQKEMAYWLEPLKQSYRKQDDDTDDEIFINPTTYFEQDEFQSEDAVAADAGDSESFEKPCSSAQFLLEDLDFSQSPESKITTASEENVSQAYERKLQRLGEMLLEKRDVLRKRLGLDFPDDAGQTAQAKTSTPTDSIDPFLVARFGPDTEPFATLTSKTISCVQGGAFDEVMFNFWATPDVTLHVCLVDGRSGANVLCSDRFSSASSGYPGFFRFKISQAVNSPFKIQYFAETIPGQQGFLILDDIGYYGSFCDDAAAKCAPTANGGSTTTAASTTTTTTTTQAVTTVTRALEASTTTRLPIRTATPTTPTTTTTMTRKATTTPDVCKLVGSLDLNESSETFSGGSCGYESTGGNVLFKSSKGDFINSPPIPRMFQIRNSRGYYMGAAVKINTNDLAILSSPRFGPSTGKTLTFNFYRSAVGATLKICFDVSGRKSSDQSKRQCVQQIPPLSGANAMSWNFLAVTIPADAGQK
uniref:PH domain-containing protein n=1 Tax=Romanomermis culicivorax TaxID=13658 RepID=A0A915KFR1_ROMCU